jgi:transposase-like protein
MTQRPMSALDIVEEAIRAGAFIHDAAARVGVHVETLRDWRRLGVNATRQVAQGLKRRSDLSKRERQYAELAYRMEKAEADARLLLLGTMQRVAQGGITAVETVEKVDATGNVLERTTRRSETLPDQKAAAWLLGHRWPEDFHGRQELTGPEGGPVHVETTSALDKLRNLANRPPNGTETPPNPTENSQNGTQPPPNGHKNPVP